MKAKGRRRHQVDAPSMAFLALLCPQKYPPTTAIAAAAATMTSRTRNALDPRPPLVSVVVSVVTRVLVCVTVVVVEAMVANPTVSVMNSARATRQRRILLARGLLGVYGIIRYHPGRISRLQYPTSKSASLSRARCRLQTKHPCLLSRTSSVLSPARLLRQNHICGRLSQ